MQLFPVQKTSRLSLNFYWISFQARVTFVKLHHVFLFVSFLQLLFILLSMFNDSNFIDNYQGSKVKFEFGTRCKFLDLLPKF